MKNIFCCFLSLFIFCGLPVFSSTKNELTEISCEVVRRISYRNYQVEAYENWGFYIDDTNRQLYFAPSKKPCFCISQAFNKEEISLQGMPFMDDMSGELHINRKSGAINMRFQSKSDYYSVVTYTGRCQKVEEQHAF